MDLNEVKVELARDWARVGPFATCDLLGVQYRKEGRSAFICCPWHKERTPSCTVGIGPEGTIRVHCFPCESTWDIHAFFAQVRGLELQGSAFKELLIREAETLTRWDLVETLEGKRPEPRPVQAAPPVLRGPDPEPEPEREYLEHNAVMEFFEQLVRVDEDEQVALRLVDRVLDPKEIAIRGLAMAIPDTVKKLPEWARYKGQTWIDTGHWLIIPAYDEHGVERSVRAWRVVDNDTPKRLPPAGHKISGLVMADAMGVEMLRAGGWPEWATTKPIVVIAEGEPDFLTWALKTPLYECPKRATLGIYSGSWTDKIAARIPDGAEVVLWTDDDKVGDKYAVIIAKTLKDRCSFRRGTLR